MPLGAISNACASNGTVGGRLHAFSTDVSSKWPLDTAECEGSNNKLQDETGDNPAFSPQKQLAQRVAASALVNPTSNLWRASCLVTQQFADTLLEHSDMDKVAVDR